MYFFTASQRLDNAINKKTHCDIKGLTLLHQTHASGIMEYSTTTTILCSQRTTQANNKMVTPGLVLVLRSKIAEYVIRLFGCKTFYELPNFAFLLQFAVASRTTLYVCTVVHTCCIYVVERILGSRNARFALRRN